VSKAYLVGRRPSECSWPSLLPNKAAAWLKGDAGTYKDVLPNTLTTATSGV